MNHNTKIPVTVPGIALTTTEIILISKTINIEPATLKAVQTVETGGRGGFVAPQKPTILFEGHIFWKMLVQQGINPHTHIKGNENILYPKWDHTKYIGGIREYERLQQACRIHKEAAYNSASWGMFQIMGFNHLKCGIAGIQEFVTLMSESEYSQLKLTASYLKNSHLLPHLRNHDWDRFALAYNGAGYAQNHYAEKLKEAYRKAAGTFK